jgi:parallel beta-helix repeat protein
MRISKRIGVLAAVTMLALVQPVWSGTVYVAGNGMDGAECSCGSKTSPCRSITCGIRSARDGDTVLVGPGMYRDFNGETPSPGCGCMLSLNKPVVVMSSDGAASTVIDATLSQAPTNVLMITDGGEFGRPGHGFTVTQTGAPTTRGIVIDSANVKIRGNQVIARLYNGVFVVDDIGIYAPFPTTSVLIEGNQVIGWFEGIVADGSGKMIRKNHVLLNLSGIYARGGDNVIVGNVVDGNFGTGIHVDDSATVTRNAVEGNGTGFFTDINFVGRIEKNNIVGNPRIHEVGCGLTNFSLANVVAPDNYWGAATGPGPYPADDVCNDPGNPTGTTSTVPFATKRFSVRAPIRP